MLHGRLRHFQQPLGPRGFRVDAEADAQTIACVEALAAAVGLNQKLRELGVSEAQVDALADQAIQDGCHQTNPVPVTREDLKSLYLAVL